MNRKDKRKLDKLSMHEKLAYTELYEACMYGASQTTGDESTEWQETFDEINDLILRGKVRTTVILSGVPSEKVLEVSSQIPTHQKPISINYQNKNWYLIYKTFIHRFDNRTQTPFKFDDNFVLQEITNRERKNTIDEILDELDNQD